VQKAKGDIRILEQALEMYRLDMFDYPEQEAGLEALKELPSGADEARYRKGGYIKLLPNDPWGRPYVYRYPGENGVYDIISLWLAAPQKRPASRWSKYSAFWLLSG